MPATPKHNRFEAQTFGRTPTYICGNCSKRTRETGEGESSVELCKRCYIEALAENNCADNHNEPTPGCPICQPVEEVALAQSTGPAKRLTVKAVTKAIQAAGLNGELVRGNGYYYFAGPAFEKCQTTSVMTHHIAAYSIEEWIELAKKLDLESLLACRDAVVEKFAPNELPTYTATDLLNHSVQQHAEYGGIEECPVCQYEFVTSQPAPLPEPIGTATVIENLNKIDELVKEAETPKTTIWKQHAIRFAEIEHDGDLQDALDALHAIGCSAIEPTDVDFDHEYAVIDFTTTMTLKEVKDLLAHTNVCF